MSAGEGKGDYGSIEAFRDDLEETDIIAQKECSCPYREDGGCEKSPMKKERLSGIIAGSVLLCLV